MSDKLYKNHRSTDGLNKEAIQILKDNQLLDLYYTLTKGGRAFINKAIRINQTGEAFSKFDFPKLKKGSFKQKVFNFRHEHMVETVYVSGYAYYRVIGFRLDPSWENLTAKPTGVSVSNNVDFYKNQEKTLEFLKQHLDDMEDPALHNIRVHFDGNYLYDRLQVYYENGDCGDFSFEKSNKTFMCTPQFCWDKNISVTIIVTSKNLVQVIFKNTFRPIAVNEYGMYELLSKLGEIRHYLNQYYDKIPQTGDWDFVRADYGCDSKKQVNANFHSVFNDYVGAMCQIYAKCWKDGKSRLRVEKVIYPKTTITGFMNNILSEKLEDW